MCRLRRPLCCVSMCGNGVHYDGGVFEYFLFSFSGTVFSLSLAINVGSCDCDG